MWCGITVSSGYCRSQRMPVRECRRTASCSMKAMARTPSHLTSKSHSSPRGGLSARVAIMGSMAAGMAAWRAPFRPRGRCCVFFCAALRLRPARGRTLAPRLAGGCCPIRGRRRRRSCAWSCAPAGCCAISSCVRPESTLQACASTSQPGTANSSRFLMSSHSLPLPRLFMWTSANSPFSFSPCSRNFRSPRAICSAAGVVADQFERAAVPQHHAARAVIALRECCPRNRRTRADDLPHARPGASARGRARGLWERPRTSARRRSPGGNRSAGAWRRAAGRRSSWPADCCLPVLPGGGSGVFVEVAFARIFFERHKALVILPFTCYRLVVS